MPLGETAPIILKNKLPLPYSEVKDPVTGNPIIGALDNQGIGVSDSGALQYATGVDKHVVLDNSQALLADLTQASSATIIEMRKAVVLQQWMERRARSGSRYIEYVKADFNVNSSDSRLQRPEFCGGATTPY